MISNPKDAGLVKRFYLTELFANIFGAPCAAAYGAFMIDFSRVSVGTVLLDVAIVVIANQVILALPMNLALGRKIAAALAAWRSGREGGESPARLHTFFARLPFLQAGLVFGRMVVATVAVLALIAGDFDTFAHAASACIFALYSSFAAGLVIYYYLQAASSKVAEDIVAETSRGDALFDSAKVGRLEAVMDSFPLMVPTLLTSLGVFFLVLAMGQGGDIGFYSLRVEAALVLNILTCSPILIYSRHFHKRRLRTIRAALDDMIERGDTTRRIATDLGDEFALTAHRINRAFDLFRLVLSQMQSTHARLAGTVAGLSDQIRETVAATTQQASAVKEVVGTMESSTQIDQQIQESATILSGNAGESRALVDEGFGKVQDTVRKIEEIKQANLQTLSEIGELGGEISDIGEIIDVINKIANQTRVIAFNAELEASSAGTAGVSFRIVAEEIRRLANSTVDSLAGIKAQIGQIQKGSERLLASSEEGTVKIEEGMRLSGDLHEIFARIRGSAEGTSESAAGIDRVLVEQGRAFDQIFVTLKQISEGAGQVLGSAEGSRAEVGALQTLCGELEALLARFGYDRPAKEGEEAR